MPSSITTYSLNVNNQMRTTTQMLSYNVARYKLAGSDFLFCTVSNDASFHGDISFQLGNNICCLLLLVPRHRTES